MAVSTVVSSTLQPPAETPVSVVYNPVTGAISGEVPKLSASDVITVVDQVRSAQPVWAALSFKKRARIITRFHDALLNRREEIMNVIQSESGKSRRDAFVEVFAIASECRYYAYHGEGILKPQHVQSAIPLHDRVKVVRHPYGVVGVVGAWNFPLILTIGDTIPALLAGNTVVIKPSSRTPLTAIWAVNLMRECGLPKDVLQVVTGPASELGNALIEHSDYLMFTGSTRVGKELSQRAAARMIPYSMELGGKNALIVMPDANLRHAAQVVVDGSFNNCGQVCVSFERIYIHVSIFEKFKQEIVRQTDAVRFGYSHDYDADLGSLVGDEQVNTIEEHIRDAVSKGARVVYGGKRMPKLGPHFFTPTVLENVGPGMVCYKEETFGPLISLYPFSSIDDAVREANDSRYGLHFGVYTNNKREGERIAQRLQAGSVCVNDSYISWGALGAPMGGFKESGVGRRHGREGILKFTQPQTIVTNLWPMQISTPESPMAINKWLADLLANLLLIWRHIPFLR